MIGDERRFLIAEAQVFEQLGDVEDVVEDAEAVVNQLLNHGRAPAGPAETSRDWARLKQGGEHCFLRWGQFGRPAGGLVVWRALDPIAAQQADPAYNGLLMHAQNQGYLRKALAVYDRQDGEEILDLAQVGEVLGSLQVALHFFTVGGRNGKTNAAHRDFPPQ